MNKYFKKKRLDELYEYLQFRHRGSVVESKKLYSRKQKHKKDIFEEKE